MLALEYFPTGLLALRDVLAKGIAHASERDGEQIEFAQMGAHRCGFGQVKRSDAPTLRDQFSQGLREPAGQTQRQPGRGQQSQQADCGDEPLKIAGRRNQVGLGQQHADPETVPGADFKLGKSRPPSFSVERETKAIGLAAVLGLPLRHRPGDMRRASLGYRLQGRHLGVRLLVGSAVAGWPEKSPVIGEYEHHPAR